MWISNLLKPHTLDLKLHWRVLPTDHTFEVIQNALSEATFFFIFSVVVEGREDQNTTIIGQSCMMTNIKRWLGMIFQGIRTSILLLLTFVYCYSHSGSL